MTVKIAQSTTEARVNYRLEGAPPMDDSPYAYSRIVPSTLSVTFRGDGSIRGAQLEGPRLLKSGAASTSLEGSRFYAADELLDAPEWVQELVAQAINDLQDAFSTPEDEDTLAELAAVTAVLDDLAERQVPLSSDLDRAVPAEVSPPTVSVPVEELTRSQRWSMGIGQDHDITGQPYFFESNADGAAEIIKPGTLIEVPAEVLS